MYQTFNENQYMLQSQLLRHGELNWLARDTYFGDQRNYLETHIDDNFLPDDSYTPGAGVGGGATDYNAADALREQPADVTKAADWSKANNFRIDMLYNGGGSTAVRHRPRTSQRSASDGLPGQQERLRVGQPYVGSPEPRPGLRESGLHPERDHPEHDLGDRHPRADREHGSHQVVRR